MVEKWLLYVDPCPLEEVTRIIRFRAKMDIQCKCLLLFLFFLGGDPWLIIVGCFVGQVLQRSS